MFKKIKDIRLYTYESGILKKSDIRKKFHNFNSIEEAEKFITVRKQTKWYKDSQFVIIEYFDKYNSKIKKII